MSFCLRFSKLFFRRKKEVLLLTVLFASLSFLFTNCSQPIASSEMELLSQNIQAQLDATDAETWSQLTKNKSANLVAQVSSENTYNYIGNFYGDSMSVVMLIDTQKLTDSVFVAESGAFFETNRIQYIGNQFVFEKISSRQSADHSVTYKTEQIVSGFQGSKFLVVAAQFYTEDKVTLHINGRRLDVPRLVSGSPSPFSYLMKNYQFSPAVLKGVLFNTLLTPAEINLLSRKFGSFAGLSLPYDMTEAPITEDQLTPITPFALAKSVMQTNCFTCHSTWATYTEAQFLAGPNPLVVKNDLANSKMYYRLKGTSVGAGPQNMPLGANALSPQNILVIENWIKSIQ